MRREEEKVSCNVDFRCTDILGTITSFAKLNLKCNAKSMKRGKNFLLRRNLSGNNNNFLDFHCIAELETAQKSGEPPCCTGPLRLSVIDYNSCLDIGEMYTLHLFPMFNCHPTLVVNCVALIPFWIITPSFFCTNTHEGVDNTSVLNTD